MRMVLCACTSAAISVSVLMPALSQPALIEPNYDKLVPGVAGPQDNAEKPANVAPNVPPPATIKLGKHGPKATDPLTDAKKVGLMPLSLRESNEEIDQKLDYLLATEKSEMVDLWEATLTNSPDIQFVTQRLMPTANVSHATTIMSRLLSAAIVGAIGTMSRGAQNPGTVAITQSGGSILSGLLGAQDRKMLRKQNITDEQIIILYKIVRDTADKLVENYRTYKLTVAAFQKARADLADYQGMALELSGSHDAFGQMEAQYVLRKQQGDIEGIRYKLRQYRLQIVDLAGAKATSHLDEQLEQEFNKEIALPTGATPWDDWARETQPGS
jgi:hypothetical protein